MKRKFYVLLPLLLIGSLNLNSCGSKERGTKLSFSGAVDINTINKLDGKLVNITGFMATLSPVNGEFMYLMNLPYQSCPFCIPNTSTLSNTIAVYAKNNKKFDFTDQAITVTGKIEVGEFIDSYGYDYTYRIVDARYEVIDLKKNDNKKLALWYSIASDGLVSEVYSMFDYLYFLCYWPTYYVNNSDGSKAYYLYPTDAKDYLELDKSYGYAKYYKDDYFPSLIKRAKAIDESGLSELISIIEGAKTVEQEALKELEEGNYTSVEATDIGNGEMKYSLTNAETLANDYHALYNDYVNWLGNWEL